MNPFLVVPAKAGIPLIRLFCEMQRDLRVRGGSELLGSS
jgi:hypothetical protein